MRRYRKPSSETRHIRPLTVKAWLWAIALASVAIAASSFRIVLAPGFELYLGPLFYLLAYRLGGLRLALPMAVLTTGASWFWWGHVFTIVMALGHVLFIHRARFFTQSLAIATFVYFSTIGAVAAILFLHFHYEASPTIMMLAIIRKIINDVLLAAIIDLVVSVLYCNLVFGGVKLRRNVSLSELLPASINFIVFTSALLLFVNSVYHFPREFGEYQQRAALSVELRIREGLINDRQFLGFMEVDSHTVAPNKLFITDRERLAKTPAIMQQFNCSIIDDGTVVTGPNDRNTFAYWMDACHLARVVVNDTTYFYLYSTRPIAESGYREVLLAMIAPSIILALALMLDIFIVRALRQSILAWKVVAEGFGQLNLSPPPKLFFAEFDHPVRAIVAANHNFAVVNDERKRIAQAVSELKQQMDLSLAADIRFDETTGHLVFNDISLNRIAQERAHLVHPNDCLAFSDARNNPEAFIEFRLADDEANEWYLLVARDLLAPGRWRSGWIVRLRQSKLAQNRMLQQARLVELGGMASALSHELKQPLFTISLCSENGRLLIDNGSDESIARAYDKFDKISEQINRARSIIARISRYARIDNSDPEPLDIAEVISTTMNFMRPLLVQHDVKATVVCPDDLSVQLLATRVGLEQVLVNIIQNAVDGIDTRREAGAHTMVGAIEVNVAMIDGHLIIALTDNGTGLTMSRPESAFDAFMTTKMLDHGTGLGLYISRQILMEMGAKISIASREPPETGAVVTIDFPAFALVEKERNQEQTHEEADRV
ncbi:ATP-binding protein [Blastomonas aquatica]|nr:ATP-binding protein [Blastomonas aquatica]